MTATKQVKRHSERLIDPYVVVPHTWTRDELLEAREAHEVVVLETHRRTAA